MADFEESIEQFAEKDVSVIAASSETLEEASETLAKSGVSFPLAYGLVPEEFASLYGAYWADDEEPYLHATGFLLDPEGKVDIAVYSCGAIGRFTEEDALHILKYRLSESS